MAEYILVYHERVFDHAGKHTEVKGHKYFRGDPGLHLH